MNVLYIIGNGLDISLGMKTGYQDFYDYYSKQETSDTSLIQLKNSIEAGRYYTWADLEAGLGKYSAGVSTVRVFLNCLDDIRQALISYINEQFEQKAFIIETRFLEDFFSPQNYLDSMIQNRFNSFVGSFPAGYRKVSPRIVTLNYTSTLEYIFTLLGQEVSELLHLHGSLEDGIVMGVSDAEQIANETFRSNRDVIEEFVKPSFNDSCLNNNNVTCERWIKESDIIVLYGTSVGVTDRKWWKLIGERLVGKGSNVLIVYFPYDEKKDVVRHPNYKLRWTEAYQRELMQKLFISEDNKDIASSRICVGINKPIFQLKKSSENNK